MNDTHPFYARRMSRRQLVMLDAVVGACAAFIFFTVTVHAEALSPWMRLALPAGLGLPLALRRLWPLPVFCFTLVIAVYAALSGVSGLVYLAPAYVLYIVALSDRLGPAVPTSAIAVVSLMTIVGMTVAGTPRDRAPDWLLHLDQPLLGIAALGGAWTIGRAVQERRSFAARDAERMAAQAVAEERLRIARELHDVVTHSVGLIAVKAGVANHVMATKPEEAHDALRVIETASRSALVEMRHLLGVLRSTSVPDRVPTPGLAGIQGLVRQARLAGVEVELDLRVERERAEAAPPDRAAGGDTRIFWEDAARERAEALRGGVPSREEVPRGDAAVWQREEGVWERLPGGVGLAAYRIVQEALTNVVKHAAPTRCRVSAVVKSEEVRIEVVDEGPGWRTLPGEGAGHGLIGMRERVMMYGGTFEAGSLPGRGFRVFATLPYEEVS
ncbi:sensor histidine kinase [Nonomuraea gerenzanensis]|uniref:histidine kinase n=1 Tax=Nonomuraea gerenzanensis TaxID=93944 RepID=A0A1M4E3M1_9ACTN|nr:histidine kinase [Nonomuraea gerenzanensis]UBU15603.1 histidine kinase [Nonomuraea gerenzanensis]SBO93370.1 two-component system sensor kinase [Nonomuraea gerenzanensis]